MPGTGKVKIAIIGSDNSICILEFENGSIGPVEDSWARRGGIDDCIEVYGEDGVTYADRHMGNALPTFSERGYGYAVEKAPTTSGWSWPVFEELWNYGFRAADRPLARTQDRGARSAVVAPRRIQWHTLPGAPQP